MLLEKVKKTVKKYSLVNHGDRVVVAVSGGPDSVCLLSVLTELAGDWDLSLHIAHLDHMFRGKESADEALFVDALAKKLSVPATVERINVPAFCSERGLSSQEGARKVRYEFLSRVADKVKADRIATGHTATDQAETFLLRLLRGAGVRGLSAIPPVRDKIIRPLIEIAREEVLEHLQTKGLEYVLDSSNTKPVYARNRVRSELLPVLRQFNPRIVQTLATEASLLRDEEEAVKSLLVTMEKGVVEHKEEAVVLNREAFNRLPVAFRRRLLKRAVESAGTSDLSAVQMEEALTFLCGAESGRVLRLPCGFQIEREYDAFAIRARKGTGADFCHTLAVPGITRIADLGIEVESLLTDHGEQERREPGEGEFDSTFRENYLWQALLDYDKIGGLLSLRNRRPGDWFCPSGMGGRSKKLQDYFVDEKVPRSRRDSIPLLVSGDDMLWVIGFRADERFRAAAGTKRVLVVRVRRR